MSDGMGRELAYLSSHATNRYFIPNWGNYDKKDAVAEKRYIVRKKKVAVARKRYIVRKEKVAVSQRYLHFFSSWTFHTKDICIFWRDWTFCIQKTKQSNA